MRARGRSRDGSHARKQVSRAFREKERADSPLAGALAGGKEGIVDVHCGLHAPAHHALPHLQRLAPVALHAAPQNDPLNNSN